MDEHNKLEAMALLRDYCNLLEDKERIAGGKMFFKIMFKFIGNHQKYIEIITAHNAKEATDKLFTLYGDVKILENITYG